MYSQSPSRTDPASKPWDFGFLFSFGAKQLSIPNFLKTAVSNLTLEKVIHRAGVHLLNARQIDFDHPLYLYGDQSTYCPVLWTD
jgi:hypothetical protein